MFPFAISADDLGLLFLFLVVAPLLGLMGALFGWPVS